MNTLALFTTLLLMNTANATGNDPANAPGQWASGQDAAPSNGAVETIVLKPEAEPEVSDLNSDDDGVHQLFGLVKPGYFSVDTRPVRLAHGNAITWLGCSSGGRVRGGYGSDKRCGTAFLQPTFEGQLEKRFFMCAERAAAKANLSQPQRIFINHDGSYNNRKARNSSRLSMHAYARAIDIAAFNLIDAGNHVTKISTNVRNYRGQTKTYYNEFRQCWKDAMPSSCRPGMTEYKGSIGIPSSALGGNKLHNDHIHLSYALCAGK